MRIIDSWPQVDGGRRYLVVARKHIVLVDADKNGRLSGTIITVAAGDAKERRLLQAAFDAVHLEEEEF